MTTFCSSLIILSCLSPIVVFCQIPLPFQPQVGLAKLIDSKYRDEFKFEDARRAAASYRLPKSIVPTRYDMSLTPILDPTDRDFLKVDGQVDIYISVLESTNLVTLHSDDIIIREDWVSIIDWVNYTRLNISNHLYNKTQETYTIVLADDLKVGIAYRLSLWFTSRIADDRDDGILFRTYTNDAGFKRYAAVTQFKPFGARRAFPCFDEPEFKTLFDIGIGYLAPNRPLANMRSRQGYESSKPFYYESLHYGTPPMSTYLVAFVVSEFTSVTGTSGPPNVETKIWGPAPLMNDGAGSYASTFVGSLIEYFSNYLDMDMKYPIEKMDFVAIDDFPTGAMESYGLNIYTTSYLLEFPWDTTENEKFFISAIAAHQISHQWFGNKVTMGWWNDLWLNEGLATYMMYLGSSAVRPEFDAVNRMVIENLQEAMALDAKESAKPIHGCPDDPVDFSKIVTTLVSTKGASLIRMIEGFLSKETLQKGLQLYLKRRENGTAVQDDLFQAMTDAALEDGTLPFDDVSVGLLMEQWTIQPGFPIVQVLSLPDNLVFLNQTRFYESGPSAVNKKLQSPVWPIPIAVATQSNPDFTDGNIRPTAWLNGTGSEISVGVDTRLEWILLNPDARSYYRVLYDRGNEELLLAQLQKDHTVISSNSRSQILDDYFKSGFAGYIEIGRAMEFTIYLDKEQDLAPWTTALSNLRRAYDILQDTPVASSFKTYISSKINSALEIIGSKPRPEEMAWVSTLRALLWDWVSLEADILMEISEDYLAEWMANPGINPIPVDIQPMVYCLALYSDNLGEDIMDFYQAEYSRSKSARQKRLIAESMSCLDSSADVEWALNLAMTEWKFERQDIQALMVRLASHQYGGKDFILSYVIENVNIIVQRYEEVTVTRVISQISRHLSTTDSLQKVADFVATNTDIFTQEANQSLNSSIESIRSNIVWRSRFESPISTWLNPGVL